MRALVQFTPFQLRKFRNLTNLPHIFDKFPPYLIYYCIDAHYMLFPYFSPTFFSFLFHHSFNSEFNVLVIFFTRLFHFIPFILYIWSLQSLLYVFSPYRRTVQSSCTPRHFFPRLFVATGSSLS